MLTRFIEATQGIDGGFNHGKFMVGLFDVNEWDRRCEVDHAYDGSEHPLLARTGWGSQHILVLDLQTGEGAIFKPGGIASADLNKHKVWVCPMFEPFLTWLYEFIETGSPWFDRLPVIVELPDAPAAMSGYRREGVTA
jgi:hypothetical protein